MGITGLLPFLKKIQRDVHISSFRGKKAAIDAYCWLHRGAYSCSLQLVMKTEKLESLSFIRYCMKRLNLLRKYDVTPVMVFDGGHLPTKSGVEKERRKKRDAYLKQGKALLKDGNKSQAVECFQKCVDVSPEMALALIKECRREGVECIVAPYEADAQLAYLQKENIVDLVITEDSDMLVFGCKRVLYKMDDSGNGKLMALDDLGKANSSLVGFTQDSFRQTCILSGCDYLASVPGIGLGKASKFMKQFDRNPHKVIKHIQRQTGKVPKDYEESFRRAEHTFLYQLVFDPRTQTQVRLNEPPDDVDPASFEFAGVEHSPRKAVHMARGNIDPFTHEVLDTYTPSKAPPPRSMSWEPSTSAAAANRPPLHIQARLPLTSSRDSKLQFKPPDLVSEDAGALGDEDLKSMYSSSGAALEPSNSGDGESTDSGPKTDCSSGGTTTLSRYFGKRERSNSSDDCVPSDVEVVSHATGELPTPQCDDTSTPSEILPGNIRPSLQSAKKRLCFFDNEHSTSNLHDRYAHAKAKKACSEVLFAQMDSEQKLTQQSASSPEQSKRNPFSKPLTLSQQSTETCTSDSQCSEMSVQCGSSVSQDEDMATPPAGITTPPPGIATPPPGIATPPPGLATPPVSCEDSDPQSSLHSLQQQQQQNDTSDIASSSPCITTHSVFQSSYRTSRDFITSHASYESCLQASGELRGGAREQSGMECTLERPSLLTSRSTNKRAPLSGRKVKPSTGTRKMNIGLSKRGSSSNFNPPRSANTTLTQATLFDVSRFNFQKKERMTL